MPYKTNSPQNMNAKKLSFLLLILVAVACTNRSTSSEQDEVRHWNNVLQQINALLLENKALDKRAIIFKERNSHRGCFYDEN